MTTVFPKRTLETVAREARVLLVSHNVFSETTGMGKTLASLLSCLPPQNLAQLYFHSEIPTLGVSESYFRITDSDVLKSVVTRKAAGREFRACDIQEKASSRTDSGVMARVYQYGRRRTAAIYALRNRMWSMGAWYTIELRDWIRAFQPNVVFFAAGDYSFSYSVVQKIAEEFELPIVLFCADDYYFASRFESSAAGARYKDGLMNALSSLKERIVEVLVISDKMKAAYRQLFQCPISVFRISSERNPYALPMEGRKGIVYTGNLGVGRADALVELGKRLHLEGILGFECIDVYSGDKNEQSLAMMTEENGIRFHGSVSADGVRRVLAKAAFVLHIESFEPEYKARTAYSLSTKIGDCLQSGACIIAYGPRDIASIEYLEHSDSGMIAESASDVCEIVQSYIRCPDSFRPVIERAKSLARSNHSKQKNDDAMLRLLAQACGALRRERKGAETNDFNGALAQGAC